MIWILVLADITAVGIAYAVGHHDGRAAEVREFTAWAERQRDRLL